MHDDAMPDLAHRRWSPRLSEFLDGDLDAADTRACDAHLRACAVCRDELAALAAVKATLRALPADPLPRGGFAEVAARLTQAEMGGDASARIGAVSEPPRGLRAHRAVLPWLAAAAAVAVLVRVISVAPSASGPALRNAPPRAAAAAAETIAAPSVASAAPTDVRPAATRAARPSYDAAVTELRDLLGARRDRLAPETVAVLERSLAAMDAAIAEAEAAVARDTADPYLSTYLARARARKLALLRQAALLVQS